MANVTFGIVYAGSGTVWRLGPTSVPLPSPAARVSTRIFRAGHYRLQFCRGRDEGRL